MMPDHDQRYRRLRQALWLGRLALVIVIMAIAVSYRPEPGRAAVTVTCRNPGVNMIQPNMNVSCFPGNQFYSSAYWWGTRTRPGTCAAQGVPYWRLRWVYKTSSGGVTWTKIQSSGTGLTAPTNDLAASEWISNEKVLTCRIPAAYTLSVLAVPNDPFIITVTGGTITKTVTVTPYDSNNVQAEKGPAAPTINLANLGQWWTPARDCATAGCEARLFDTPPVAGDPVPELRNYAWDISGVTYANNDHPRFYSSGYYSTSPPEFGAIALKDEQYFERPVVSSLPQAGNYYITLRTGFTQPASGTSPPPERLETSIIRGGTQVFSFVSKRPNDGNSDTRFYQCVSRDPYYLTPTDTIRFTSLDETVHVDWYRIQGTKPAGVPDCDEAAASTPPQIQDVKCAKGDGAFINCGLIRFNEKIQQVEVDCADAQGNGTISQVTVALDGLTTGHLFDRTVPLAVLPPPGQQDYSQPYVYRVAFSAAEQIALKNDTYTITANCVSGAAAPNPDSQTGVYLSTWTVGAGSPPAISNFQCNDGSGWRDCTFLNTDNLNLTAVRAQCTDPDSVPGTVVPNWSPVTTTIPGGGNLFGQAAAEVSGKIYLIGGQTAVAPAAYSNRVWEYDPASNSWAAKADLPGPARRSLDATAIDNKIFVSGGFDGSGPVSRLDIFDPLANTWSAGKPLNVARYGHKTTTTNGKLFLIGGINSAGETILDPREYDIQTDQWQAMAAPAFLADAVSDHAFVAHGNELYVIGGNTATGPTRQVFRYLLDQALWFDLPDAPGGVGVTDGFDSFAKMTVHEIDGKIYLFGGGNAANNAFNYVWRYMPETNGWKPMHRPPPDGDSLPMGNARFNHASAYAAGNVYVFGGFAASGYIRAVEAFAAPVPSNDDVASVKLTLTNEDGTILNQVPAADPDGDNKWEYSLSPSNDMISGLYVLEGKCADKKNFTDQDQVYWDVNNVVNDGPVINSITPPLGLNNNPAVAVAIGGKNFLDGARVTLRQPGTTTDVMNLTNVVVSGEPTNSFISGQFDLTIPGVTAQYYDVFIDNADGQEATLPNGFQVVTAPAEGHSGTPELLTYDGKATAPLENPGGVPTFTWKFYGYSAGVTQEKYLVEVERFEGGLWKPYTTSGWKPQAVPANTESSWTPSVAFPINDQYRWRVKVEANNGNISDWSIRDQLNDGGRWDSLEPPPAVPSAPPALNQLPSAWPLAGGQPQVISGLAVSQFDDKIIYAGLRSLDQTQCAGVYKSTDGGYNWTAINNGLFFAGTGKYGDCVSDLQIAPKFDGAQVDHLFMSSLSGPTKMGGLWEYNRNNDNQWELVTDGFGYYGYDSDVVRFDFSPYKDYYSSGGVILIYGYSSEIENAGVPLRWGYADTTDSSGEGYDVRGDVTRYQGFAMSSTSLCNPFRARGNGQSLRVDYGVYPGGVCGGGTNNGTVCANDSVCTGGGICRDDQFEYDIKSILNGTSGYPPGELNYGGLSDFLFGPRNACINDNDGDGNDRNWTFCRTNATCDSGTCYPGFGRCYYPGNALDNQPCSLSAADCGAGTCIAGSVACIGGARNGQTCTSTSDCPGGQCVNGGRLVLTAAQNPAAGAAGNGKLFRCSEFGSLACAGGPFNEQRCYTYSAASAECSGFPCYYGDSARPTQCSYLATLPSGDPGAGGFRFVNRPPVGDFTCSNDYWRPIILPGSYEAAVPRASRILSYNFSTNQVSDLNFNNNATDTYSALDSDAAGGLVWVAGRPGPDGDRLWRYDDSWGYFAATPAPPPTITSISPNYGFSTDTTARAVTITGTNFLGVCNALGKVELQNSLAPSITLTDCVQPNATTITGNLPLKNTPVNTLYNLYVQNSDGNSALLDRAFFVYGVGNLTGYAWTGATDPDSKPVADCGGGGIAPCATPGWLSLSCSNPSPNYPLDPNSCYNPSTGRGLDYGSQFFPVDYSRIDLLGFSWLGMASPTFCKGGTNNGDACVTSAQCFGGGVCDGPALGWTQFDPDINAVPVELAGETTVRLDPSTGKVQGLARILKLRDDGTLFQCVP